MLTFTLIIQNTFHDPVHPERGIEKDLDWHVGDIPPSEFLDDGDIKVLSVMADSEELTHIIQTFTNLPYTGHRHGRSCVWRGEMARFIFDNL